MIDVIKAKRKKLTDSINIENDSVSILDIGAGTGAYSVPLAEEGYDVSAVELVKHNLARMKQKCDKIKARHGNALNLRKYESDSFDIVLLFGPMYHLFSKEDKVKALNEAILSKCFNVAIIPNTKPPNPITYINIVNAGFCKNGYLLTTGLSVLKKSDN